MEAAHVRYPDPVYGKRSTGMQEKPSDQWTVPLSPEMHRSQHEHDELKWWKSKGIDPLEIASKLYAISGNLEAGELIIKQSRPMFVPVQER